MQVCLCSIAAPGGSNDIAAFRKIQLSQMIQKLPPKKIVVGDNAYICSETFQVNDEMAWRRTGKEGITVAIMLHCLLRWLAGDSYIDIRLSAGISPAYFYTSVYKCIGSE